MPPEATSNNWWSFYNLRVEFAGEAENPQANACIRNPHTTNHQELIF
ncbi:MAG: hypothetical protein JWP81_2267 [Ferruginibacter sp.]|nr:hypothetical protein [Ferruginibacter sp.]